MRPDVPVGGDEPWTIAALPAWLAREGGMSLDLPAAARVTDTVVSVSVAAQAAPEATSRSKTIANQAVCVIDAEEPGGRKLARSFRDLGYATWLAASLEGARARCRAATPGLVVTELRVGGRWAFDFVDTLDAGGRRCPVVIVTAYPSVASAVRAVREGFVGLVTKPAEASAILRLLHEEPEPAAVLPLRWPSLDRTVWEYINQVALDAGTISAAARRLGLDRRSFRRMLAKYPPAR
jgi:ActR/RegA family two-component response regulator